MNVLKLYTEYIALWIYICE